MSNASPLAVYKCVSGEKTLAIELMPKVTFDFFFHRFVLNVAKGSLTDSFMV